MLREKREKRKKGRTGIEPAAQAEPLPALSAVLHKVQVWGSPTSPSSRLVPKAEDQLHSTREFGQVLAKFLRQKTNSTVLPLHSREGLAGIRPSTVLPLHSREGLAGIRPSPMPPPPGLSLVRTSDVGRTEIMRNCTVRALPRWSPTRVLDTPMVA